MKGKGAGLKWFCIAILMLGSMQQIRADHITGGEIFYTYAGNTGGLNVYQVTMKLFMRCNSGRNFPNPAIVGVFNRFTNALHTNISATISRRETIEITEHDPCISNPPTVCYEFAFYEFTVSVPPNAEGYLIVGQVNFRINGINNLIPGSTNIGATYTAEIPGTKDYSTATNNNSARFTANDLVVVCANNPFTYSFGAVENGDDQLRYFFCGAYQTGTSGGPGAGQQNPPVAPPYASVPYGNGFSAASPLGSLVTINESTGLISGIAPAAGIYVVTVCVEERRSGIVIATQRKDIQINITNCSLAAALLLPRYQLCGDSAAISITNEALGSADLSYRWQLFRRNGIEIATGNQPVFNYQFANGDTGLYKVSLRTTLGTQCPDSAEAPVYVYPGFKPAFDALGTCFGSATQFTDRTSTRYGKVIAWKWDFAVAVTPDNLSQTPNPRVTFSTAGNHITQLRVENENGCIDSISKTIVISAEPPIALNFRDTLICPPDTLQLRAAGEGTFMWQQTPGMLSNRNMGTILVAPLQTTIYKVRQELGNCISNDSIIVRVTDKVFVEIPGDTTICNGDSISLKANTNANLISWRVNGNNSIQNSTILNLSPTERLLVTINVSISKCKDSAAVQVKTAPYPTANAGKDTILCWLQAITLNATTNGDRFEWVGYPQFNILNPTVVPERTTNYILRTYYDTGGCKKPADDTVNITVRPPVNMLATNDTAVVVRQPLQLNANGALRYLWQPAALLNRNDIPNPVFVSNTPSEGLQYSVIGFDAWGCSDSARLVIRVFSSGPSIYVPTAFTPNNDGLNDGLRPIIAGIRQLLYFKIFNRYGQLVFETATVKKAWDGTYSGKPQASGNFVWMVQAIDYEGNLIQQKGNAILIR
ncbi:MAG: gliding motility-associated C-terminal domain-containing protein [Chitinophagaceae bacterium]|nr:gliding motility-associated C-terminal domain-containing protein [Chitinophagaceae bacterium]